MQVLWILYLLLFLLAISLKLHRSALAKNVARTTFQDFFLRRCFCSSYWSCCGVCHSAFCPKLETCWKGWPALQVCHGTSHTETDSIQPDSSPLEGLWLENDRFLWQHGTYKLVSTPYTWVNLTNVIWVEQPFDSGCSQSISTTTSETDIAYKFLDSGNFIPYIRPTRSQSLRQRRI